MIGLGAFRVLGQGIGDAVKGHGDGVLVKQQARGSQTHKHQGDAIEGVGNQDESDQGRSGLLLDPCFETAHLINAMGGIRRVHHLLFTAV